MFDVVCENDSLGNCKVLDAYGNEITSTTHIGNVNPFRWKSFYFDAETGLYYANGSYYDPETGLYLNAAPMESIADNVLKTRGLDRNGFLCYNFAKESIYIISGVSGVSPFSELVALPDWMYSVVSTANFALQIADLRQRGSFHRFVNAFGFVGVAIDAGLDIHTNIQQHHSSSYIVDSATYTIATGLTNVLIGLKIGAMTGNIPLLILWAVGSIFLSYLFELIKKEFLH